MKFDDFLKRAVADTVEGGSGNWPKPVAGEAAAYAEGLRLEAHDIDEGRGPWLGVERECRICGRPSLSLEDGECPGCLEGAEEKAERVKRANEAARPRAHHQAADVLRRLAQEPGINATFRTVLLEEADILERRAS